RVNSIRIASEVQKLSEIESAGSDTFLEKANASISFVCGKGPDERAFELINKTNQFNLNGRRLTEGAWNRYLHEAGTFLVTVSYRDKYAPLGKIAALLGKMNENRVHVHSWVLSCRAFSRRIEHHCLKFLFDKFEVNELVFDYIATDRNVPLQDFFNE